MSLRSFVGAIAALLLALGLGGVLWPVTVDGPEEDSLRCGGDGLALSVPVTAPDVLGGVLAYDTTGELVRREDTLTYEGAVTDQRGPVYRAGPWDAECATALNVRKLWSAPALVIGGVTLVGVLLVRRAPEAARDY